MIKHYAISIIVSVIVISIFVATMFLIMLPQVESLSSEVVKQYSRINSDDFQFVETKHLVTEILSNQHSINENDIATFEKNDQYNPGNTDPFTPKQNADQAVQNSNQQNAQQNNNNSSNAGKPITGTTK